MLGYGFQKFKFNYMLTQNVAIGDVVSSENFSAGGYMWKINCYPRGDDIDGNNEHLSLYLQLVSESKNVKAIFHAFVVRRDGMLSSLDVPTSVQTYPPKVGVQWGWNRFLRRSNLELANHIPNKWAYVTIDGMVTIICGVIVVQGNTLPVSPPSNLASHLGNLLDSTLGTDVSFVVGGETFPAHRAVLAARSPVFSAELFGSMADATMPTITLQDIDPAAFKVMLRFVYTDSLPADDELGDSPIEMLLHLLAAADRYGLDHLKVLCELKLWENISVETVASILACAETYNCPELKTKCMDFFAVQKNFNRAVFTDGFSMLLQKFPVLAAELGRRVGK